MNRTAGYRGQPVLVLLLVVAAWMGARTVLWQAPFPPAAAAATKRIGAPFARGPGPGRTAPGADAAPVLLPRPLAALGPSLAFATPAAAGDGEAHGAPPPLGWAASLGVRPDGAATPLPSSAPAAVQVAAFPQLAGDTARAPAQRWSGDAWLLLRQDTTRPVTSGRGSYGQSQAGAVLRYRLDRRSGHRPALYGRASTALGGARDVELALGLTARPLPGVPLAVAGEVRGADAAGRTEVRPAAFAYTELPPFALPLGARAEAYVQGGWVGGRFETPFVDGQLRVDRAVFRLGRAELRAGAGAWGGAQKGAERLDVGPGATVALTVAGAPVRMSADWRFRVAGEAHPHSGPALTVSTGF